MEKDFKKDFDKWNKEKKKLDVTTPTIFCHKREIWWCALGLNVGFEQHSMSEDFSRPVVVVRRFTDDMFWGVPLTTKINDNVPFRVRISNPSHSLCITSQKPLQDNGKIEAWPKEACLKKK